MGVGSKLDSAQVRRFDRFNATAATVWRASRPGLATGDGVAFAELDDALVLVVIDGAGSGEEAAHARDVCADAVVKACSEAGGYKIAALFQAAHEAARDTRGAAMAIARYMVRTRHLEWAAIGDIDGLTATLQGGFLRPDGGLIQRGGVVGYQMPSPLTQRQTLPPGAFLVFSTDGVRRRFRKSMRASEDPALISRRIISEYSRENDDALALAIRFDAGGAA